MKIKLYTPFAHWGLGGKLWMYSDPHFTGINGEDEDMRVYFNYATNEEQVEKINKKVFRPDTLIILGDVGDPSQVEKLKAHYKILIKGNHDKGNMFYYNYFDEVYDGPLFISNKILLSHEPILSNCWMNIHGHNHNPKEIGQTPDTYEVCLAANIINYEPFDFYEFVKQGGLSQIEDINSMTTAVAAGRIGKGLIKWKMKF